MHRSFASWMWLPIVLAAVISACVGDDAALTPSEKPGEPGGKCLADNTCNVGLECNTGVCVPPRDASSSQDGVDGSVTPNDAGADTAAEPPRCRAVFLSSGIGVGRSAAGDALCQKEAADLPGRSGEPTTGFRALLFGDTGPLVQLPQNAQWCLPNNVVIGTTVELLTANQGVCRTATNLVLDSQFVWRGRPNFNCASWAGGSLGGLVQCEEGPSQAGSGNEYCTASKHYFCVEAE